MRVGRSWSLLEGSHAGRDAKGPWPAGFASFPQLGAVYVTVSSLERQLLLGCPLQSLPQKNGLVSSPNVPV